MKKKFDNTKLDSEFVELKVLLKKLNDGNYQKTAEVVFDHVAHTGVESDLNPELKKEPILEEFLSTK